MALSRGFSPAQFRDVFLGVLGPFQVTATIPSTAAGAITLVSGLVVPGAQVGDIVLSVTPSAANPPTAGLIIDGSVTAANTVGIQASNATGGVTYNPGSQVLTLLILRPKTA